MMELHFDFQVVGGGFDGVELASPAWIDDGKTPCPELIFVGVCPKGADCGSDTCRRSREHVSYWTPDEQRPAGAVAYRKQDEHVERNGNGELRGRAVYAIGGLLDPRNFGALAQTPLPATTRAEPLTTAAAERFLRAWERAPRPRPCRCVLLPAGRHDRGWPR